MAVFSFRALDANAAVVQGTLVADSPHQVREQLRQRGLTIQRVTASRPPTTVVRWRRGRSADVVTFIRELSTLLGVGIPLVEALETLTRQQSARFRPVTLAIQDRVASGASLAEAMRDRPDLFDELTISITEVGESAGTIDEVLGRLADFKERGQAVRSRVINALMYPAIVFVVTIGVALLLMTSVVPKLLGTLLDAGRPIPLATRIVKTASDFLVNGWWAIGLVLTAAVLLASAILRTPAGRLAWHRLQLRIPVLGPLLRKETVARIAIVIATLMRSGVVFVRAIQIAQRTTTNLVLKNALLRCEQAVTAGSDIAGALRDTDAFPPMVVQIFAVGEQSGRLEEMLERLAADYERQTSTLTQRLTTLLEPILILFMVALVGLIALATILPMMEAADAF